MFINEYSKYLKISKTLLLLQNYINSLSLYLEKGFF